MNPACGSLAAALLIATVFLPLTVHGDDPPTNASSATIQLLSRDTIVPVRMVTRYFPDVTEEAGTGPNETTMGKAIGSISAVFTSADGRKKVTLSVDEYTSAGHAAAAFQAAVDASSAAPGFKLAAAPDLGQEAFAGSSQVGAEMHFGLGARDGRLIISATHAGDIPVTPANSNSLISLADVELTTAKQVLGP